ncbi:MAG: hypothetical protein CM1200mP41_37490 [Gammaproteobacteria bacterium]|nr:MAG: hypothetical protein CM1200mP41_37490 [Gammaproteobacteria bacterium]
MVPFFFPGIDLAYWFVVFLIKLNEFTLNLYDCQLLVGKA